MGFSFYFSSLYPAPYIELYVCEPIQISYLNFRAVLGLPKTAGSAQTHKSMSVIWIVWSTLYVYLWFQCECPMKSNFFLDYLGIQILSFLCVHILRNFYFPQNAKDFFKIT